jgi:hypothetical protein
MGSKGLLHALANTSWIKTILTSCSGVGFALTARNIKIFFR